jgi:hypothetical protein
MKRMYKLMTVTLLVAVLVGACNMPRAKSDSQNPDMIKTYAAETIQVMASQSVKSPQPLETREPTQAEPTETERPQPTDKPEATNTPRPSPTKVICDRALFINDVTVPDGTTFGPSHSFVKTWRLQNNGSCTWNSEYRLVFVSGNAMNGPASVPLNSSVAPGQTIDISVSLKSPSSAGTYKGYWMLQNASSADFGIGDKGDKSFWVDIVVGVTETAFAVTSVDMSVSPASGYSGTCPPLNLVFKAKIHASKAGTVTYYFQDNEGNKYPENSLTFDEEGTKTVSNTLPITGVGDHSGYMKVYINKPNHQFFPKISYDVTCTP